MLVGGFGLIHDYGVASEFGIWQGDIEIPEVQTRRREQETWDIYIYCKLRCILYDALETNTN